MTFPFYIFKGIQSVLSEKIETLKSVQLVERDEEPYQWNPVIPRFSGKQVLYLLTSLSALKNASVDFSINSDDASVINFQSAELVRTNRLVSGVENLSMNIYVFKRIRKGKKGCFSKVDQTIQDLLAIFIRLRDVNLSFFDYEKSRDFLFQLDPNTRPDHPTLEIFQGLKSCLNSITSLSILGFAEFPLLEQRTSSVELIAILKGFRNPDHLRIGASILLILEKYLKGRSGTSNRCYISGNLETLELAYNYEYYPDYSVAVIGTDFISVEEALITLLKNSALLKSFKIIKTFAVLQLPKDSHEMEN